MGKVKVCVLRTKGTNCELETAEAFRRVGADTDIIFLASLFQMNPITKRKHNLNEYDILALPGGFSHGDYIRSGKVFASDLRHYAGDQVEQFVNDKKPIIGICNGFQVLVNYGLLPSAGKLDQTASLTYNDCSRFRCDWVRMRVPESGLKKCLWTKDIREIALPMAHGEGKFMMKEKHFAQQLLELGEVPLQYVDLEGNPTQVFPYNPNGSMLSIAGVCNQYGNIFGLMPHPERALRFRNHPDWALRQAQYTLAGYPLPEEGEGLQIFQNAVDYVGK